MSATISNEMEVFTKKYASYNLLLPSAASVEISPIYKFAISEITVDTTDTSGDIFFVGKAKTGRDRSGNDIYENQFSLAKPALMKLASAAGIQFHPEFTSVIKEDANTFVGRAYGAIRLPDGMYKTHMETKRICLDDEEARLRLEYLDKSIMGITDWIAAKEAAKMFRGKWKKDPDNLDRNNRPIESYVIADSDRDKYIERSLLVSMTQLRKTVSEKAQTGAILRVIRALLGIKGTYSMEELKKPFAVMSVNFQPDYTDQKVKNALLQQGMRSMSSLFGTSASTVVPFADGILMDTEITDSSIYEDAEPVMQPLLESEKEPKKGSKKELKKEPKKESKIEPKKESKKEPENVPEKLSENPKMTVKDAKKFRLPDDDPFYGGLTLEEMVNQPGGVDYLKNLQEDPSVNKELVKAANLILQAIEYMKTKKNSNSQ